ncbi:MAG: AI-2E family transporter [Nonlabens sp.]
MMTPKELSKGIAFGVLRSIGLIGGILILLLFLYEVQAVLAYIGIAAVVSLVGRPIVIFLHKRLRIPNIIAVLITLFLLFIVIIGAVLLIIPIIVEQADNLGQIDLSEVQANLEVLNTQVSDYFRIKRVNILERLQNLEYVQDFNVEVIPEYINTFLGALGDFAIGLFSILFIAFFLLRDSRLLLEGILVFAKRDNEGQFQRAFKKIKELLSRYFIGLIAQVAILFILYSVLLLVVGIEHAIIIAFFCALLNLVPYLGPAIGYLMMSGFVISDNLGYNFTEVILPKLLIVLIGYGIIQAIDNFVNQPLIFGKSVKSHPLEIFIVILTAGVVFGVMGLVLAIPTYTAIKVISKEFLSEYKIVKKLTHNL